MRARFPSTNSRTWIDFRGIQDAFMRDRRIDYFENSRRATYVHQQYAITNPAGYEAYETVSDRDCQPDHDGLFGSQGTARPDCAKGGSVRSGAVDWHF